MAGPRLPCPTVLGPEEKLLPNRRSQCLAAHSEFFALHEKHHVPEALRNATVEAWVWTDLFQGPRAGGVGSGVRRPRSGMAVLWGIQLQDSTQNFNEARMIFRLWSLP